MNSGIVSITPIGSPIAGENYTLECSAGGSTAITFEWLGPPDGGTSVVNSNTLTVTSNSSTSQLQFRPLQQSHNGLYSCRVTVNGQQSSVSSLPLELHVTGISRILN